MSIRATDYALELLPELDIPSGARTVLLALAARANSRTADTYTGRWLSAVSGLCDGSVRRHIHTLTDLGVIALDHRPGRASVVRFPVGNPIAEVIHNPAQQCQGSDTPNTGSPRALVRDTPRSSARGPRAAVRDVSGSVSGSVSGAPGLCSDPSCSCDGTGWVYEETTRTVTPCTQRRHQQA